MRGLEFWGVCFVGAIGLLMLINLVGGVIWRGAAGSRKTFVERMRKQFQERYPHFKPEKFTPVITEQSGCCRAMLWTVLYNPPRYFCDKCGKENVKGKNEFTVK